jgi:hypothetical protein
MIDGKNPKPFTADEIAILLRDKMNYVRVDGCWARLDATLVELLNRRKREEPDPAHDIRYPEHAKLRALKGRNMAVGDFVEWLRRNEYAISTLHEHTRECYETDDYEEGDPPDRSCCTLSSERWYPVAMLGGPNNVERWVEKFFGISPQRLAEEKDAMLRECRAQNVQGGAQ